MKQKTEHQKETVENIYQLNGTVPIVKAIPFGLQHILGKVCWPTLPRFSLLRVPAD